MAQKLYPWNIDGSKRYRPDVVSKPTPKRQRSRRRNGKLVADGRSATARRLRELIEDFGFNIDLASEEARAAVVSTARLAVEAEDLGDANDRARARGEPVDGSQYATLVNARDRGFARLKELRAQARPSIEHELAPGPGGWSNALARHLHQLVFFRDKCGDANPPQGKLRDELLAEYAERERRGEFVGANVNGFVCGAAPQT
jgi:hypothetical protein